MEYVLMNNKTGEYVGIDKASGGYPYDTSILKNAEIWNTKAGAKNYAEMFPNKEITLHEIFVDTKPCAWD